METRTEDRLFEDFRLRGDTAALAVLFDRTAKDLLRIAVHLTGDLGDAEDLVQETFLAAIRGARRYRPDGRVRGWLAGILQNHARRLRRRQRRRGAPLDSELPDPVAADGLDAATAAERRSLARDALERVPEPYRTVLGLRYAHGFSVQEIAAALERPANTVQSQLQRGTERLRRMLPGEGGLAALAGISTDGLGAVRSQVLSAATGAAAAGFGVAGVSLKLRVAAAVLAAAFALGVGVPWASDRLAGTDAGPLATPASVEPPNASSTRDGAAPERTPAVREVVEPAAAPPPVGAELVALRVVEAGSLRPVPGARVIAFDSGAQARIDALAPDEWRRATEQFDNDLEAYQLRFGVEHVADAAGVVRVPQNQAWGAMSARWGVLYGERCGDESDRIVLAPDRELRVRVVDHAGRPAAGILLGLGDGTRGAEFLSGGRAWIRARADQGGVAVFPHAQAQALELGERRGRAEMCVVAFVPGVFPEPVHRIPLGGALPSSLDLRLPPAGTAEVRVRDVRGDLVGRYASERLGVAMTVNRSEGRFSGVVGADGVARFASLPVGRGLRFTAQLDGYEAPAVVHPGVRHHGEALTVELPFGADATIVCGRAVDAGGRALAGAALLVRLANGDARRVDTDVDGAFRLVVQIDHEAGDVELVLHRIALRRRGPIELDERLLGSAATLRGVPRAAGVVHDVGDVVFAEPTRLGAGTWRVDPPSLAGKVPWIEPTVERRSGPESDWSPCAGAFVAWHEDGTFVVHGDPVTGTVRVRGRSVLPGLGSSPLELAPLEFMPGARDLHVDVVAGSELVLDFLGPKDALRFDVLPDAGVWPSHDDRKLLDRQANTSVTIIAAEPGHSAPLVGPLWPGRYRVAVRLTGIDEPVLVLDDLEVPAATRVRPLFEHPLDVRDRFDLVDAAFVDGDGREVRSGTAWLRSVVTGGVRELPFDHGRLVRGVRRGGWRAVATAPGRGAVVFDGADRPSVRIPPRRRVSFALRRASAPDQSVAPPPGVQLLVDLEPAADHPLRAFADVPALAVLLQPRRTDDALRLVSVVDGAHVARVLVLRNGTPTVVQVTRVAVGEETTEVTLLIDDAALR